MANAKRKPIIFTEGYQLSQGPNGTWSVQSIEEPTSFYSVMAFLHAKWTPFSAEQRKDLRAALAKVA